MVIGKQGMDLQYARWNIRHYTLATSEDMFLKRLSQKNIEKAILFEFEIVNIYKAMLAKLIC